MLGELASLPLGDPRVSQLLTALAVPCGIPFPASPAANRSPPEAGTDIGSAMPLVWARAEFIELIVSRHPWGRRGLAARRMVALSWTSSGPLDLPSGGRRRRSTQSSDVRLAIATSCLRYGERNAIVSHRPSDAERCGDATPGLGGAHRRQQALKGNCAPRIEVWRARCLPYSFPYFLRYLTFEVISIIIGI
jgi:hypothetical protein